MKDDLESVTGIYSYSDNPLPKPMMTNYMVGNGYPDAGKINAMRNTQYMKKDSKRIGNFGMKMKKMKKMKK